MKIICGLGNPGKLYELTHHNMGFLAIDELADRLDIKVNKLKFKALLGEGRIGDEKVILVKPQTYMNLSGEAVAEAVSFYKIPAERVIVVSDEMSLPIGKLRIREKGSAGGHNGLKNIIQHLGTDAFPRIRLGVGAPPHPDYDVKDWVLSVFRNQDAEDMAQTAKKAAEAVECYITSGAQRAMNRFN